MNEHVPEVTKKFNAKSLFTDPKGKKLKFVKRCLQLKSPYKEEGWRPVCQFCHAVAWTGALVIIAVILRSLYLLYMKPEGT